MDSVPDVAKMVLTLVQAATKTLASGLTSNLEQLGISISGLQAFSLEGLSDPLIQTYKEILDEYETLRCRIHRNAFKDFRALNYNRQTGATQIDTLKEKYRNHDFEKYIDELDVIEPLIKKINSFVVDVKRIQSPERQWPFLLTVIGGVGVTVCTLLSIFGGFAILGSIVTAAFCVVTGGMAIAGLIGIVQDVCNKAKNRGLQDIVRVLEELRTNLIQYQKTVSTGAIVTSQLDHDNDFLANYNQLLDCLQTFQEITTQDYMAKK